LYLAGPLQSAAGWITLPKTGDGRYTEIRKMSVAPGVAPAFCNKRGMLDESVRESN
jgi:hypothetical protein